MQAVRQAARKAVAQRAQVRGFKVAVAGAAGGIVQPLSLLMKDCDLVSELRLFDIVNTPGVAADCSHIPSPSKCVGYKGAEEMGAAFDGCDVVVIPAGVPRKPGMTRDDLFNTNAGIVQGLAEAAAKHCPNAALCIISNPVNSTVPICAETLKNAGVYDPSKLFGVTTLDVVRANTFVAENQGKSPRDVNVTVIGGHAGITILPLLSQTGFTFSDEDREALTNRIQFGGDEVVKAKDGLGSATLSMAYAGARFAVSVLRGLNGEKGITECCFVESSIASTPFSSSVTLGTNGVEEIHGFGSISDYEQEWYDKMI